MVSVLAVGMPRVLPRLSWAHGAVCFRRGASSAESVGSTKQLNTKQLQNDKFAVPNVKKSKRFGAGFRNVTKKALVPLPATSTATSCIRAALILHMA